MLFVENKKKRVEKFEEK